MDRKDVYEIGNDIMNAVNDAVGTGDFTGLNETLKNVTGAAAGSAADALYNLQGHLQGGGASGTGNPNAQGNMQGAQGGRTYGYAGRSAENQTEAYMKRAAGARHHTTFASRVSPFLQRKISRASGTGKIVGGIMSLVCAGFALMETIASGLLGIFSPFGNGFFSAWSIFALIIAGGLAILGGILIKGGQERKRLVREYYEYGKIAGTGEYLEIGKLAHAMGESRETVLENLEKMMSEGMLPAAWFDKQKTTLMLSERMYNEYLELERQRQEQEAEEAKKRMAQNVAQGGANEYAAVADSLPDDLKLRPEDEKLPKEARKIVEEGLLYMGRIRAYNDDIADEEVSAELTQLETTMKRILEQIRKDPSTAPNLRRLMVYYLPTTMKLLQAYKELDRQPAAGENIRNTRQEIREALGTINEAFDRLLDSLFQDMAWDISSDISVMKTMMAQDGLTGQRIRETQVPGAGAAANPSDVLQAAGMPQGVSDGTGTETVPQSMPAQSAVSAVNAGEDAFDSYTDGFTEGLADEEAGGIQLKFGE